MASDGDHKRRPAFYLHSMRHELTNSLPMLVGSLFMIFEQNRVMKPRISTSNITESPGEHSLGDNDTDMPQLESLDNAPPVQRTWAINPS